jgi:hypothetical protein
MFFWIFKWSILSFILIFLIHYLYTFLLNMFTIPKIRDLIHKPKEQYNELLKNYKQQQQQQQEAIINNNDEEMYSELKKYVEELKIKT